MAGPGQFIQVVGRRSGGNVPAKVVEASLSDAVAWHDKVQVPFIAQERQQRIDWSWHWPTILLRSGMVEALSTRPCAFVQLLCPGLDGDAVPVGQVLLVAEFPFISDRAQKSIFLWYLTAMPQPALRHFGVPDDIMLLRSLVDIALQFGFMLGHQGRTCLHADRHGTRTQRNDLAAKYTRIGLQRVTRGPTRLLVSPLRVNDGRYFVADAPAALHCSAMLDAYR